MKRILLVDDDALALQTLVQVLKKNGYQVSTGSSGAEGLARFLEEPPDLVVSDVVMPDMDGLEFCRQLRQQRTGELVPFLFLSSLGEVDNRLQGYELGADDYLIKPVDHRELLAKIEAQIERSRRYQKELLELLRQPTASSQGSDGPKVAPPPLPLTPAEERVFWEVIQGATNKQVGETLFISHRTVQTHLTNILSKLSLENRSQLVRFAFENGYRTDPPEGVPTK